MDVRTGDILSHAQIEDLFAATELVEKSWLKQMQIGPTPKQLRRKPILKPPVTNAIGRVGRNDTCPCGSGKKFKYCCLNV